MNKKLLAIANAIFLLGTLVVNYLATSLPIAGRTTGELSDLYPNLFVPSGFTFAIRGVIYMLLIGFVIRQLLDAFHPKSQNIASKLGPWFIVSCIANMGWIFAWHHLQIGISVFVMLLILTSLIIISLKIKTTDPKSRTQKLLLHIPFGVYLGWISVATIANISTYLVNSQRNMLGMTDVFWTVVVICVATALGVTALYKESNIPYSLVILRAFYGIATKRIDVDPIYAKDIIWTLAVCSMILTGTMGWRLGKRIKE